MVWASSLAMHGKCRFASGILCSAGTSACKPYLDAALQLLPALAQQLPLHVGLQNSSKVRSLMPEQLYLAQPLLDRWARQVWSTGICLLL